MHLYVLSINSGVFLQAFLLDWNQQNVRYVKPSQPIFIWSSGIYKIEWEVDPRKREEK